MVLALAGGGVRDKEPGLWRPQGRWLDCFWPLLPCCKILNFSNPIWQKLESYKVFDLYLMSFKMHLNNRVGFGT